VIMRELEPFAAVPRIVSLLDPGWQHFMDRPDAHVIFRNGIGMCRLTELSDEIIWNALRFGRHGHRFILLRLSPNKTLPSILPPKEGGTFLIARLTSQPAVTLFDLVCKNLGFEAVTDTHAVDREIGLLSMMGWYF